MSRKSPKHEPKTPAPARISAATIRTSLPAPSKNDGMLYDDEDSDDSMWDEDDGIDDEYAENLYDFMKHLKKTETGPLKALYSYIVKVFEDKEVLDEKKLDRLGIDDAIGTLKTKFNAWLDKLATEDGSSKSTKQLTKELLVEYMEAGLNDNFEDDGWILKDE